MSVEASPDDPTPLEDIQLSQEGGLFRDAPTDNKLTSRAKCVVFGGLVVAAVLAVAALVLSASGTKKDAEARSLCSNRVLDLKDTELTILIEGVDRKITEEEQIEIQQDVLDAYNDVSAQCDDVYKRWMYDSQLIHQRVVTTADNSTGLAVVVLTTVSCDDCPEAESFASIYRDAAEDVLDVRRRGMSESETINVADFMAEVEKKILYSTPEATSVKQVDLTNKGTGKTYKVELSKDYCKSGSRKSPSKKSDKSPSSTKSSKKSKRFLEGSDKDEHLGVCSKYGWPSTDRSSKGSKSGSKSSSKGSKGSASSGSSQKVLCPCKAFNSHEFQETTTAAVVNFDNPFTCQKKTLDPKFPQEPPKSHHARKLPAQIPPPEPLEGYNTELAVQTRAGLEYEVFANIEKHEFACRTLVPLEQQTPKPVQGMEKMEGPQQAVPAVVATYAGSYFPIAPQQVYEVKEHISEEEYEACQDVLDDFCDEVEECPCFRPWIASMAFDAIGPYCELGGSVISKSYTPCDFTYTFAVDLEQHTCYRGIPGWDGVANCPQPPPASGGPLDFADILDLLSNAAATPLSILHLTPGEEAACKAIIKAGCGP